MQTGTFRRLARAGLIMIALASSSAAQALDLVTLETAFNPITVDRDFGARVVPLLAELHALGVRAYVKCFAAQRGPHVKHSLHLWGGACDVLPIVAKRKGRNRMPTPALMFTRQVAAAIARAGLRNGCTFRDCGHIDAGLERRARFAGRF